MTKILTMVELLNMQESDLLREIDEQRHVIARLHHGIGGGSEKNTHLLNDAKRQLARMFTVLSSLRMQASRSTMPAPAAKKPDVAETKAASRR
ncbi:MAG TPA: 50S ribosomal protein L29 [Candidatus Peribacterales bacterium]|nr:50S ribosomal protein L29 [Candidatus Peribacterales bacterium]